MLPDPKLIEEVAGHSRFLRVVRVGEEVGGDLYDAFMIDDRRLFFMIGDVSGKGVPASLFMALTKTLCKSLARRELSNLGQVLSSVNDEISRENPTAMFVWPLSESLMARSGELESATPATTQHSLASAGIAARTRPRRRPPLCLDDGITYPTQRLRLGDGDILLLITEVSQRPKIAASAIWDGANTSMFGQCPSRSAAAVCRMLHADVKNFSDEAAPSDDLTLVAIGFRGASPITVRAVIIWLAIPI